MQTIAVKRLASNLDLSLPAYETAGSAGMDLRAAVVATQYLAAGQRLAVPTGLSVAIPQGFVGLVCGRSGLALRHGVTCTPSPGVIDSDYRGEVMVTLVNLGVSTFIIERGDRVAQLLVMAVFQPQWHEVDELTKTERGTGGFGSTGAS